MLGAIIGDCVGSRFEWNNVKTKDFEFFHSECDFTDDTVMTLAVAKALLNAEVDFGNLGALSVKYMRELGSKYPDRGYGESFVSWLEAEDPLPYNSWGNGSAMRVSACGWIGKNIEEVKRLSRLVTEVTHNHPKGIKGAEATAVAVFLARTGTSPDQIKNIIKTDYYDIDFTLDEIRFDYSFDVSCQGSVPQALVAFFESTDFEDAIRNAVSIGGDSDTIAAITGSVAEAYYGIPEEIKTAGLNYLTKDLKEILNEFYKRISV